MSTYVKSPCDEGVIRSAPDRPPCSPHVGLWVLVATILGSSMAFIDGTVVNVALPVLQVQLNATTVGAQWVIEAYSLFLASLILVGGALGDYFGRRRIFATGILIFTLASIWCGLSPNILQLIIARAAQGIGGALLVPGSLAIISATFSDDQRGKAIGTWSGFTSITTVIGPVIGGWLVQYASWRWVFFINVPIAVIVLVILFWRVPESRDEGVSTKLDWWGTILTVLGLGSLVFGLIEAGTFGLGSPLVLATLAIGLIALAAFVFVESRVEHPLVPLQLFRSPTFSGANILTLFLYAALSGLTFFLPFNLIQVQGYSPTAAGSALVPFALTMFLLSRWAGGLVDRYGAKLPLVIGPIITACGFLLFARTGIGGSYWLTYFPAVIVMSLGMATTVSPLTTAVMGSVPTHNAGTASGTNNAVSRSAGLLSIAIFGIVFLAVFSSSLDSSLSQLQLPPGLLQSVEVQQSRLAGIQIPPTGGATHAAIKGAIDQAFLSGFRLVSFICAGLALASSLIAGLLIEGKKKAPRANGAPQTLAESEKRGAAHE
jgi:EmrB/QacA subfamily drug resistance transporter